MAYGNPNDMNYEYDYQQWAVVDPEGGATGACPL